MNYCESSDVKPVLQLETEDTTYDLELTGCVSSSSALVDALLKAKGLAVPFVVPQLVIDASKHFAAWEFRRRRDPTGAEAFWMEANRILDTYAEGEKESYVGSA